MGRFGGRGGGRGKGKCKPGDDRPTLPRGMREEIEAASVAKRESGFEDSDLGEKMGPGGSSMRDGGGGMGGRGGRGGRGQILDRKAQRTAAKERERTQRQQWSERKARVKAKADTSGGGGGGGSLKSTSKLSRDTSGKGTRRGRGDDDDIQPLSKKQKKNTPSGDARGDRGAGIPGSSKKSKSNEAPKKKQPVKLTPELRMSYATLEAYKRDEAEQKRLLKLLKGRQKGPDDGLGDFFDKLPGMELLDDDGEKNKNQNTALGRAATKASNRKQITMDSDSEEGDPFGFGGEEESDEDEEEDEEIEEEEEEEEEEMESGEEFEETDDEAEESDSGEEDAEPISTAPTPLTPGGKYVPPALRAAMAAEAAKASGTSFSDSKLEVDKQSATRQVRGLMNRMGESNVPSIVTSIAALASSLPRRTVGDAATSEAVKALNEGLRVSSQYAAAVAAFVAGLSGALGPEVGARFGVEIVRCLNEARGVSDASARADDDTSKDTSDVRAASNAAAVFSRLFVSGLFPSPTVWGFLEDAAVRLSELDATLMLGVLRVAGAKLRSEDPVGMKRFIEVLQKRVSTADDAGVTGDIDTGVMVNVGTTPKPLMTKRARLMLDMVIDLKNNKRQAVVEVSGSENKNAGGEDQWGFPSALSKWVKSDGGIGDVCIALRTLNYDKLLPQNEFKRKGQWWLPEAAGTEAWFQARDASRVAERNAEIDAKTNLSKQQGEGAELLKKAKTMRMNTESRKAVFCIIMGAEDFTDALDGLLRLPLADAQHREIPRVLIECVLQEKAYNPYYETLASKLCERAPKKHRLTLQLMVWDQIRLVAPSVAEGRDKEFGGKKSGIDSAEKVSVRRVAHLARFVSGLLISGAISPPALKIVDFGGTGVEDAETAPTARLFRRLLLQALLSVSVKKSEKMTFVFQTIAAKGLGRGGEIGALRASLERVLANEKFVCEGLSKAEEDRGRKDSVFSVLDNARRARRILMGELA